MTIVSREGMTEAATTALRLFADAVTLAYGDRLEELIIFGSRARGDASGHSDLDVAVVLNDATIDRYREKMALTDIAYEAILETGIEVQPWPVSVAEWIDPRKNENPALIRAMQRDGRRVEAANAHRTVSQGAQVRRSRAR
jgi:antitoxin ChpS